MNSYFNFKTSLVVVALLVLPVAQAATISKAEHKADRARVNADYEAGNAKSG